MWLSEQQAATALLFGSPMLTNQLSEDTFPHEYLLQPAINGRAFPHRTNNCPISGPSSGFDEGAGIVHHEAERLSPSMHGRVSLRKTPIPL